MNRLITCLVLLFIFAAGVGSTPYGFRAECLIPPAFDPGVGELYVCSPEAGERHLIEYARERLTGSVQKTEAEGTEAEPPTGRANSDFDRGRLVYEANCAICHGLKGDGSGMATHHFRTKPTNFQAGKFKFRSTLTGSLPTDKDLFRTITQGVGGTGMIPQTHLSEADRWSLVRYIKTLSPRFEHEEPASPLPIPPAPNRTPELATQGREIYTEAGCFNCHGNGGKGDGPLAGKLRDDWGRPIAPADLTDLPWKSGQTPQDLYRTIVTGLDGTPMPSYADSLEPHQIWAVVAYIYGLPSKEEWNDLGTLTGEEIVGFNVEKMHRRPVPPRESEARGDVPAEK